MKKSALFFALIFTAPVVLVSVDYLFSDVAEDHSNVEAIYFLKARGVIGADSDGISCESLCGD